MDDMMMIRPHLRVRSPGSAAWVTEKAELRLTRIISSQSSAVIWSSGLTGLMPALLTRMPIGPSWLSVSRTSAAAASGFADPVEQDEPIGNVVEAPRHPSLAHPI